MLIPTKIENNERFSYTFECFDQEQVNKINKEIKKTVLPKIDSGAGAAIDTIKKGDFSNVPCLPLMELIHPWIYKCQEINKQHFAYDIYWRLHLDVLNYNVYGINDEYDLHIDAINDKTDPPTDMKLTCILNLSEEPYEGGEFEAIVYDSPHKFTSGMGLIINSLISHKVTPITKGERITLTYFAIGPAWK
tara:strand:- start:384 stop:956 length:573 start_codon:yes stop_codon:yes gene_type:complete